MTARPTVLIVDDSLTVRMNLADAFSAAGFAVELCASLADARRVVARRPVDVFVLDVLLPDGDGIELLQEIRNTPDGASACVVMLSTEAEVADRIRGMTTGADEYVGKPYDIAYLVARVEDLVRSKRPDGATTLLLVGDSPTVREVMARALEKSGYVVVTAASGEEGLRLAGARRPDAVVVDGELPGIDGPTVIRRMRLDASLRDVPCLLLTGSEGAHSELHAFDAGADAFVRKDEDLDIVLARIAAMLRQAQIRRRQLEGEHWRVREELLRKEIEAAEANAARQLAETRASMAEELERKNKELEAFSSAVSHDLRAPLRAIDGFSQIVVEKYANTMDAKGREYLQRVCGAAKRMGELIDDLLELSRVGRVELNRVPVNLAVIARQVIADLERTTERSLEVVLPEDIPANADERLIRIVLENLLGNSWKFTAHVEAPRVELGRRFDGDDPVYFVRDNGAGFDMEFAQKLFQPFQRMHAETEFPGTGVGLATVHRIVDRHGGRIWAHSAVGEGATFSFTLSRRQGRV